MDKYEIKKLLQKDGKLPSYYKPYKGPDGYEHCPWCKRRYEPEHVCENPCL